MATPYRVKKIVWDVPSAGLPTDDIVMLSKHLVESGPEDCEPQAFHDALDQMDEDEQEEFWEDYAPSEAAEAAWEADWEREIKEALEAKHGVKVSSFGGYEPA